LSCCLLILVVASCSYAQEFRIYCIDVGQGGATLFVAPSGRTLLVDSGGAGKDDVIRTVMAQAGVTSIDHFIVTHYHSDHYGGIPGLVAAPSIPVGMFHDRGDKAFLPASRLTSPTYIAYQNAGGAGADHLMRGETIQLDPAVTALCVASGGAVLGEGISNARQNSTLREWTE